MSRYRIDFYVEGQGGGADNAHEIVDAPTAADALTMFEFNHRSDYHRYRRDKDGLARRISAIGYACSTCGKDVDPGSGLVMVHCSIECTRNA